MCWILSTKYLYFKYILFFVSIRVAFIHWKLSLINIFDALSDIKIIYLFTLCVDKWSTRAARFGIKGESWVEFSNLLIKTLLVSFLNESTSFERMCFFKSLVATCRHYNVIATFFWSVKSLSKRVSLFLIAIVDNAVYVRTNFYLSASVII